MRAAWMSLAFLGILALGCASTTVRKNPGPHDRGVRYNLPKPYLLLQSATKLTEANKPPEYVHNAVDISLKMLPDYSEEYSIHVRAGIGINNTSVTLDDGWMLKAINFDVQSNTSDNINAITELLGKLPKPTTKDGKAEFVPGDGELLASCVPAYNVPLGYYESVIATDPRGKKQIYGWRYVGFFPFNPCPTAACGSQRADCRDGEIYGLVSEKGVMVFKRLDLLATDDLRKPSPAAVPPAPQPPPVK
jgi:hypothetical protein